MVLLLSLRFELLDRVQETVRTDCRTCGSFGLSSCVPRPQPRIQAHPRPPSVTPRVQVQGHEPETDGTRCRQERESAQQEHLGHFPSRTRGKPANLDIEAATTLASSTTTFGVQDHRVRQCKSDRSAPAKTRMDVIPDGRLRIVRTKVAPRCALDVVARRQMNDFAASRLRPLVLGELPRVRTPVSPQADRVAEAVTGEVAASHRTLRT